MTKAQKPTDLKNKIFHVRNCFEKKVFFRHEWRRG